MIFKSFEELTAHAKAHVKSRRVVVAAAQDEHTLEAVMKVRAEGIVEPVLVGDKAKIEALLAKMGVRSSLRTSTTPLSSRTPPRWRCSSSGRAGPTLS